MAKKNSISLYLIGMAVVLIGCFFPLTSSSTFGFNGSNAFDAVVDGSGDLKVAAILAFVGAVCGVVFSFVSVKGVPVKLISLIASVAGGIYMLLTYLNLNPVAKNIGKGLNKLMGTRPSVGLFLIIIGWIVAIVGYIKNKE